ncbi:MAG: hypothetical protein ACLQDY_03590 [Streptosporangiaceae bacterium]
MRTAVADRRSGGAVASTSLDEEVDTVRDHFDLRLHDRVALDEIDLYADVLSAVAASEHPLTMAELDEVLGIRREARTPVRVG